MNLTKENIQFIDTYLKNTDIQFVDVRIELIDYVATAVENDMQQNNRSFYDAFKSYMVHNKKQLEKDYERLRKDLQKKSFGILGRKMCTLPFLMLFVALFGLLFYWNQIFGFPYPHVILGSFIFSGLIYSFGSLRKRNYRISSIEMLGWPLFVVGQLLSIPFNLFDLKSDYFELWPISAMLFTSFFLCANVAFLVLFFEKRNEVKQKFT